METTGEISKLGNSNYPTCTIEKEYGKDEQTGGSCSTITNDQTFLSLV